MKVKAARFYDKRCAWIARGGREAAAKGREKAAIVLRQQFIARLKERLSGMTSVAQIWKAAYSAGYNACYQAQLRKIRRGELIQTTDRMRDWNAA